MHYTFQDNLRDSIIGFVQFARTNGLNVGIQETQEALLAAQYGLLANREQFRYSLKSIFCCSEEDGEKFDFIFHHYWQEKIGEAKGKTTFKNQSNLPKKSPSSIVLMGSGHGQSKNEEDSKNVTGANSDERLRKTDFSKVSEIDSAYLEQLAEKLWKQMSIRLKRKIKTNQTKGQIDLRNTIRSNISKGGELIDLKRKNRKQRKHRLIILLDVSGSMDKYSFFLLRFICALRSHFEHIEAFIFSTHLIRITEHLQSKELHTILATLSLNAHNWSSGTKIGESLKMFNDRFAKRILNGQSITVVLSDGLDTGEPELLAQELQKINLRTRKLIWLNPLKGSKGYSPTARGMSAALPEVDVFRSAHSLESILELENYLWHV